MVAVYTEKLNAQTVQFLFETFIFATAKIVCSNVTEQNNSVAGFRINLFYKSRDGKKQFIILIQDISIEKNACAEKLNATLPVSDIRKLDVEEYQLCYEGGMVLTYDGKNCKEIEVEEFLNVGNECEIIEATKNLIPIF